MTPDVAKSTRAPAPDADRRHAARRGEADALLCGTFGTHEEHLSHIADIIGHGQGSRYLRGDERAVAAGRTLFICDTYVNENPTAEQIAEMTHHGGGGGARASAQTPKVALRLAFEFRQLALRVGTQDGPGGELLAARAPNLEVDGEMHGDAALSEEIRVEASIRIRASRAKRICW